MAKTLSTMKLNLGEKAPDFRLFEPVKKEYFSLSDHKNQLENTKGFLIIFMCNHCPYVIYLSKKLKEKTDTYIQKGLVVVGINSNDIENYPEDSPERMIEEVKKRGYSFPYLFDETQAVAKKYYASCTPDFFLFDGKKRLVYRGQFDNSRPGNEVEISGRDLDLAVENLFHQKAIVTEQNKQKPSMGCNIKWKPGNEPNYF